MDSQSKDGGFELHEIGNTLSSVESDNATLARLGKKPVLKRRFAFLSILGFACTVLITWEGSLILFLVGLQNGGPAGVIYGCLLVWMGTISTFIVLSELVSLAPTSGGQYHWVSMLAPTNVRKGFSYVSGWLTLAGWQAAVASGGYLNSTLIQGLIVLTRPDYVAHNWHGTCCALFVLHIVGFFAILIPLLTLGPKGDTKEVFTTFLNLGGWSSQGLSFCIGTMGTVFGFVGGDAAIHLSEEIQNATLVVPRAIMTGVMINGSLGFAIILAVLYRAGDIDTALAENPAYPFIAILKHAMNSTTAAAILASLITCMAITSTVGMLASSSRVLWAFSRDKGIPGWRTLSKVNTRTSIPMYAVATTTIVACVLALVNIGSATAFNGIISVSIAGLTSSYLLVSTLLLHRRCTAGIVPASSASISIPTEPRSPKIIWGPWRIPGALGIANNNMNYSILVTGFFAIFSALYYLLWAWKTYHGLVVEVEPTYVCDVRA
ncbi:amino acid transporter [Bimuria novae-zelandiae CBS 107.79]|uniref:Amino acid transporter n=1 Tax=Bimuria novae-zelandiae CBS 107.79 TaxID=1447943 RepID=A0A6A5VM58_9PLEO|nr:amino acid transporter [Bimuria novae-zelandiae CBS 107.79]